MSYSIGSSKLMCLTLGIKPLSAKSFDSRISFSSSILVDSVIVLFTGDYSLLLQPEGEID